MTRHSRLSILVAAAALSLGQAPAVLAQTAGAQGASASLAAVPLNSADLEFMLYAAQTNHAAVVAASLALDRASSAEVKELAWRMIETHGMAHARLRQLAQGKGVALPQEPSRQQRFVIDGLQGLEGQHFDNSFVDRIGIAAHHEAARRFHRQAITQGRDPDIARYAETMLPQIQREVVAAQALGTRLGAVNPGWNASEIAGPSDGAAKRLVEDAVVVLDRMQDSPEAASLLRRAQGIFVLPDYSRAALGVGVQSGRGVLVTRAGRSFSNPVFYDLNGLSVGVQAGAASGGVVFLLMTERAVQQFRSDRDFSLNLDLAGALGPYSARAQASTGKIQNVVVWSGTRGTYAGTSLGVVNVRANDDLNRRYYRRDNVTPLHILGNRVDNPHQNVLGQVLG